MTSTMKATCKQAKRKYMTIGVRTGSIVKENMDKATRLLPPRRKYLDKQRLVSRKPSIRALTVLSSDMLYWDFLVAELTAEMVILSPFSALHFSNFGA